MQQLLVLAGLILALALIIRAEQNAPDPRAVCEEHPTQEERDRCRRLVDFAMSAGL